MSVDEHHVALPKLYGAPAYARPPRPAEEAPRPLDPDDLPIEAFQTEEDREVLRHLPARTYGASQVAEGDRHPPDSLHGRPLLLRALAGRLLRGN